MYAIRSYYAGFRGKIIEDPRLYFEGVEGMREVIAGLVITSYSIHYTKLYEEVV